MNNFSQDYGIPPELNFMMPNGMDIDIDRMDELNFSDKQRQSAMKLSDKNRQLQSLRDRSGKQTEVHPPIQSTNTFADRKERRPAGYNKMEIERVSNQIQNLESEIQQLVDSLLVSLGHSPEEDARKRRQVLNERFDAEIDEMNEFDQTLSKKQKSSLFPEIPTLASSENEETLRSKLRILNHLRVEAEATLSARASEKKLNELAEMDDEIDPLDAFMASNNLEVANQQIGREQERLDEILSAIARFEKLYSVITENQFSDISIADAISQRERLAEQAKEASETAKSTEAPVPSSRGAGTVWESYFRKDESVPVRIAHVAKSAARKSVVSLNPSVGGLHAVGEPQPQRVVVGPARLTATEEAAWRPPTDEEEEKQEELRNRLGY